MNIAIQVAFGVSSIIAGLLVGLFACVINKQVAETRREKTLVVEAAALAVVALLSVAGGACTLGALVR